MIVSDRPVLLDTGATPSDVIAYNEGPAVVSYGSSESSVTDGTISVGSSLALTGPKWLKCPSGQRATLNVVVRPQLPASAGSGSGGPAVVVEAGNQTGTYAPDVGAVPLAWYNLTATGNVVFAPTNWDDGTEIVLFFTQDATGSRTLSVNDGSGAQSVTVDGTAGVTTAVHIYGRTTSDLDIEVPGSGAAGPQGDTGPQGETGATGPAGGLSSPIRHGHTFAIGGAIAVPSGDTDFIPPFFVPVASGTTVKLVAARHKINGGTSATVKLQKNGVDATGFTGISVTTTAGTTDPSDVTLADLDLLALVVTGVSGSPLNLSFTLILETSIP